MTGNPATKGRRRASTANDGRVTEADERPAVTDSYQDGYEPDPSPITLSVAFIGLSAAAWLLAGEAFIAGLTGIHDQYGVAGGLVATAALPLAWPMIVESRERVRATITRWLGYEPIIYRCGYLRPYVKVPGALVELRDNAIGLIAPLLALNVIAIAVIIAAIHPATTYLAAIAFLYNTVASANDIQSLWHSIHLPVGTLLYHTETNTPTVIVYEPAASKPHAPQESASPASETTDSTA